MLITINTFATHALNSADYETALLNPHGSTSADTVFIDQSEADVQDAGTYRVNKQTKVLSIKIKNYATRYALIAQLKTWFKRGTRGDLVGTFSDDGVAYRLDCRVVSLIPDPEHLDHWTAMLETGNTPWRSVAPITESLWSVSGASDELDIDVGGKDETYLSLSLTTDTLPSVGYLYQDRYELPNKPGIERGMIAWCIVVNTAALIGGGKMQADCADLRVVDQNTGQEFKRWIENPNTTNTLVWINIDMKLGFSLVLLATVAASGLPVYLRFAVNATTRALIAKMPKTGIVKHGNEWFGYTNTDSINCRLTLGARAIYGTTMEGHTAGVSFLYIQYPLVVKYGNSSAVDPATLDAAYDDTKPHINLVNSTNGLWVWNADSVFFDPAHPNRTCAWKFLNRSVQESGEYFYIKQDAETGDPAIGFKGQTTKQGRTWRPGIIYLSATFFSGATISIASMTGDKFRNFSGWPEVAALQRSADGVSYFGLWSEAIPVLLDDWEAWTHAAVSVAAGTKYLKLFFQGTIAGDSEGQYKVFEALTCSVEFNSSDIPTGTFLSETSSFPLNVVIENITDDEYDDSITLDFIMLQDKTFEINGETRSVLYDGVNAYGGLTPDDESRYEFIRLKGNATNTIRISGEDMGGLSVVLSWYLRRL